MLSSASRNAAMASRRNALLLRSSLRTQRPARTFSAVVEAEADAYDAPLKTPNQKMREKAFTKNPVPDFSDTKAAFLSKDSKELIRAAACFTICRIKKLVEYADVMEEYTRKAIGGTAMDKILKATFYGHFCAGEDEERIQPVLRKLDAAGVGSILDYAAESEESSEDSSSDSDSHENKIVAREYDYESEAQCDEHVATFKKCIQDVANLSQDGYAAVKVTALGNPKLLARMSQAIVEAKRLFQKFDKDHDGFISRAEFEQGYK